MLQTIVTRRAVALRALLDRGALDGVSIPLRNGGTLPAALFAKVALDDVDYQIRLERIGTRTDEPRWQRLAQDIELVHEAALARKEADPPP